MIPPQFTRQPFTLDEARAAGLTRRMLAGKSWRRIGSSIYCAACESEDTWQLLHAWHRRLPDAVFVGLTAAWLYRLDVDPCHPVEVAVPTSSGIRSRSGLLVHRFNLLQKVTVRGLPATRIERTFADLRRKLSRVEYLVVADQALRLSLGRFDELAERAESPMETRLRWTLLRAGLSRPQVQTDLRDADGRFLGRADLYYPQARLVIEYDGANHRDRLVQDNRRQNSIVNAGFRVLRFTAADRPEVIATLVRRALA